MTIFHNPQMAELIKVVALLNQTSLSVKIKQKKREKQKKQNREK